MQQVQSFSVGTKATSKTILQLYNNNLAVAFEAFVLLSFINIAASAITERESYANALTKSPPTIVSLPYQG